VLAASFGPARPLRILALGAHSDDIEIGCGGTILSLLKDNPGSTVHWVVFSAAGPRRAEAERSAEAFLQGAAATDLRFGGFRDGFFPFDPAVKEFFEAMKAEVQPDLVFTHRLDDRHQDHRCLAELTWNTYRDHVILEYEIPKYEGDLGHPNVFVPLDEHTVGRKVELLMTMFGTQRSKRWFTEDLFTGVMRLRGIEAGTRHAEGFHCRKMVLGSRSRLAG
jgi:LmbE family N-acetylglucosaminyl deacetylase